MLGKDSCIENCETPNVLPPENAIACGQVVWSGCWRTYSFLLWVWCCLQPRAPAEAHAFIVTLATGPFREGFTHMHTHKYACTYTLAPTSLVTYLHTHLVYGDTKLSLSGHAV